MIYVKTTTIRVPEETRDRLNALARRRGSTAGELVADLVLSAEEDALLADAQESWARLLSDAQLLSAYRAETAEFDVFDAAVPPY
jgi:predicted DNA-binding protein